MRSLDLRKIVSYKRYNYWTPDKVYSVIYEAKGKLNTACQSNHCTKQSSRGGLYQLVTERCGETFTSKIAESKTKYSEV